MPDDTMARLEAVEASRKLEALPVNSVTYWPKPTWGSPVVAIREVAEPGASWAIAGNGYPHTAMDLVLSYGRDFQVLTTMADAIQRVRSLHGPTTYRNCFHCRDITDGWPCPTIRELNAPAPTDG